MNASHRADVINKLQKALKKHYKPAAPPSDRSLLEHLLYACCVENAPFENADEAFAKLQQLYFDWNEVRVTTARELAESLEAIPDALDAATRLKRCLQSVFESHYSFDLELLKKQNIGKTQQDLGKYAGVSPFAVEYVTQNALGGHSIPLCKGALEVLAVLDIISDSDVAKRHVPGLERSIPKTKGVEYASLLHQLGVDFAAHPNGAKVRGILTEIDPDVKDRLPKKTAKKEEAPSAKLPPKPDKPEREPQKVKDALKGGKEKPASPKKADIAKKELLSKRLTKKKPR